MNKGQEVFARALLSLWDASLPRVLHSLGNRKIEKQRYNDFRNFVF